MKTKTRTIIESETQKVQFGYWVQKGEDGMFVPLRSEEEYTDAAEHIGCSRELLDMMALLHDTMLDAVTADLTDVWRRLDEIQG